MEQLTSLLQQLAEKLGTTTEYLWGVLLKQANVFCITTITLYGILIIACVVFFKVFKKALKEVDNDFDYMDFGLQFVFGFGVVILGILIIVAIFFIPNVITAILNPEFWALNRILNNI